METIKGNKFDTFPITSLTKVSDLINFDGPLLSHFVSDDGENYLFYWVDVDDAYNKWLVVRVSYGKLLSYLNKKIDLRSLILKPVDGFLFSIDIDHETNYKNIVLVEPNHLPLAYIPNENSFYEFTHSSIDIDLMSLSKRYGSGLLEAHINHSSKVGYGTIYVSVLSPALQSINEMSEEIALGLWKNTQSKNNEPKKKKEASTTDIKSRYIQAGQYEFVAAYPGSFSVVLKPISNQIVPDGFKDEADQVAGALIDFINSSYHTESLKSVIKDIDYKIVTKFQDLLKTISSSKIEIDIKWSNANSDFERRQSISFKDADKILENISGLEYENPPETIKTSGHFVEVNIRTGHYIFESTDKKIESRGSFATNIEKSFKKISFNKTYDIIISRVETKEALKSEVKKKDIITSIKQR